MSKVENSNIQRTQSSTLRRRLTKPRDSRSSRPGLIRYRKYRTSYFKYQAGMVLIALGMMATFMHHAPNNEYLVGLRSRRLESSNATSCNTTANVNREDPTSKDMGEFPDDLFTNEERRNGGILFHVGIMVYMFAALAIVCDTFFEASLELIVERFQITDDVAGATWMAAGGSAPEFATSLIGALITKSDIGFGTIVGSAVFNVLFVIGACAFVVGGGLKLTAYPLARDSTWYTFCLVAIVLVVQDQEVSVIEAFLLFFMYLVYILIMKFNSKLEAWFKKNMVSKYAIQPELPDKPIDDAAPEAEEEEEDNESFLAFPESASGKVLHVILLPLKLFMNYSIPDCHVKPNFYMVTFWMCVVHISLYSYVMVMMANAVGVTLRIPDEVMGVTILAMGTSIPDALSSIAVAKRGHGDMAVSSSIGSNIFDITMGLPVPWLLYLLKAHYFASDGDLKYVEIHSETLYLSVGTLLLMLLCTILAIHFNKWKLDRKLGFMLLFLYLIFFIETLVLLFLDTDDC